MADPRQWPASHGWNGVPTGWQGAAPSAGPGGAPPGPSAMGGWQGYGPVPNDNPGPPWWAGATPVPWYAKRPGPGGLRLLPMTIGDLLDMTFRLFKANLRAILPVLLAVVIPWQVMRVLGSPSSSNFSQLFSQIGVNAVSGSSSAASGTGRSLVVFSGIALLLVQPLATGAVTRAVVARYRNDAPPTPLGLMRGGARWVPSILVASLLAHVPIALGSFIFLVPGIILSVMWSVTAPVAAAEGVGPWKALGRSWRLVGGRGWEVLGNLLLGGLVVLVSVYLLEAGPDLLISGLAHGRLAVDLLAVVATLGSAVQWGLYGTLVALVYLNLRVRLEGLDLDALASLPPGTAPECLA